MKKDLTNSGISLELLLPPGTLENKKINSSLISIIAFAIFVFFI
jgi:hypothetical protein